MNRDGWNRATNGYTHAATGIRVHRACGEWVARRPDETDRCGELIGFFKTLSEARRTIDKGEV